MKPSGAVMTPLPPKQGLKPILTALAASLLGVMTPLPPKQGLKPEMIAEILRARIVMTPLPPKQGLKLSRPVCPDSSGMSYDTTSTKTRIETRGSEFCTRERESYDTTSTKTRIETSTSSPPQNIQCDVMTPLPPKQGLKHTPMTLLEYWVAPL